jgi:hypothetical protein
VLHAFLLFHELPLTFSGVLASGSVSMEVLDEEYPFSADLYAAIVSPQIDLTVFNPGNVLGGR